MFKYLLNFIFVFLMLSTFSMAKDEDIEAKLQKEYGPDLTHVSFYLRYSFYKQFKIDWKDSFYSERRVFLIDYEKILAKEEAQDEADARAEAADEKERLSEKQRAEREQRAELRAQEAEEKAQEQEDAAREKELDTAQKSQEQDLQQMVRGATQQ